MLRERLGPKNPFGEVLEVLGMPGDHETEIHSILLEYGLPYKFPENVEAEADLISLEISQNEIEISTDAASISAGASQRSTVKTIAAAVVAAAEAATPAAAAAG